MVWCCNYFVQKNWTKRKHLICLFEYTFTSNCTQSKMFTVFLLFGGHSYSLYFKDILFGVFIYFIFPSICMCFLCICIRCVYHNSASNMSIKNEVKSRNRWNVFFFTHFLFKLFGHGYVHFTFCFFFAFIFGFFSRIRNWRNENRNRNLSANENMNRKTNQSLCSFNLWKLQRKNQYTLHSMKNILKKRNK